MVEGAAFRRSSIGVWVVIEEAEAHVPTAAHVFFAATCVLVGVASLVAVWRSAQRSTARPIGRSTRTLFVNLFVANVLAHTWHYADNIARPVDYLEPLFLYQRRVWSTMEVSWLIILCMSPLGVYGLDCVLRAWPAEGAAVGGSAAAEVSSAATWRRGWAALRAYAAVSSIAGGHYIVEPPHAYAWEVNGSIVTETVLALALGVWSMAELRKLASTGAHVHRAR